MEHCFLVKAENQIFEHRQTIKAPNILMAVTATYTNIIEPYKRMPAIEDAVIWSISQITSEEDLPEEVF
jgi:hypothetical protein